VRKTLYASVKDMKTISRTFIFILASIIAMSCKRQVSLTFYNTTIFDLDSLTFDGRLVGPLKKNCTVDIQKDSVYLDSGFYDEIASCVINGQKITTDNSFAFCGTSKTVEHTGKFDQDIYLDTTNGVTHIYFKVR